MVGLLLWQDYLNNSDEDTLVTFMGYFISVITVIINGFISVFMTQTCIYEKWSTFTKHNVRLSQKMAMGQWVNTAVVQALIAISYVHNYFGAGGLVYN